MGMDHRLQIHLPDPYYKSLREKAHEEGKSMGTVVREAIAAYVTWTEKDRVREGHRQLAELTGLFHGPTEGIIASEEHDRIVEEAMEEEYLRRTDRLPQE